MTPNEIIDDIRRNQYGVGLPSDSVSNPVIMSMRAKLDRALKLLSHDLYAKDIHFVLELLQNAEDNTYAEDVVPEVRLILTDDAILVQNNEIGFSEANVRSLCDVANSSKTKRLGYIGEKGIGFKSVFRVTDEPFILSNGFSFSLPLHDPDTTLGYVIPVWRNDKPPGIDLALTNIYLPLTAKGREELSKVADVHANLLLFLKKLRKLGVRDAGSTSTRWLCREGDGDRIELRSDHGTDHWRVVRRPFSVPAEIVDEKREGVSVVELVLAFPVTEDGIAVASTERPVYSFLPIRSYGFRFAIQGDFILASSREDILDRAWNHWLRDSIPSLFLQAVEYFKTDECLRTNYLAFVPSKTDVTDSFFEAIPGAVVELLKGTECILAASGRWARPSEVLLSNDSLRQILTNDELKAHTGKEFIDGAFQAEAKLLHLLGVIWFSFDDLVRCLNDTPWIVAKGDEWLIRMLSYLNRAWDEGSLAVLRKIKLIPLENGDFDSPAGGQLFFPLDRKTSYGFEQNLRVVKRSLFRAADGPTVEAARKFLRVALGVRLANPLEIINEHIRPLFKGSSPSSNWKNENVAVLLGAIEYIKDHLEQFEKEGGSIDGLKQDLYIKFVHPENIWYARSTELYFPKAYGNPNDLESVFRGMDGIRFVDPAYLRHSLLRQKRSARRKKITAKHRREHAESWRHFFARLGVEATIRVSCPPDANEAAQVVSGDLDKVIKTGDTVRIAKALRILDVNWPRYRHYLEIERFSVQRNRRQSLGKVPTAFWTLIRNSDWIPTEGHGLRKPFEVCVDAEANRSLLKDNVPYLSLPLSNVGFIADLGIKSEPTVDVVLSCLRRVATNNSEDVGHIADLYRFLDHQFERGAGVISSAFRSDPLIYVPGHARQFQRTTEVFWKDVSWLFGETRGYLSKPWRDFKGFFVDRLGVALTPTSLDYVEFLKVLSQTAPLSSDDEQKVWEVYKEIERRLGDDEDDEVPTETAWWQEFVDSDLYWTDRREFWKHEDDVFVNDQDEYYELFKGRDGFAFLKLPENRFPSFRRLIQAGGLRMLSESVQVAEIEPHYPRQEVSITNLVREAVPFIIRYLYFKENEVYRTLERANVLQTMSDISVSVCDALKVVFEFRGVQESVAKDVAGTFPRLFVRADVDDPRDRIGVILSHLLQNPRGLDSFICLLLAKSSSTSMERLMEAQRIPAMPTEDESPSLRPSAEDDDTTDTKPSGEPEGADTDAGDGRSEGSTEGERPPGDHSRPHRAEEAAGGTGGSETSSGPTASECGNDNSNGGAESSETTASDEPNKEGEGQTGWPGGRGQSSNSGTSREGQTWKEGDQPASDRCKSSDKPPERPANNWFRVLARPDGEGESSKQGSPPPTDDVARQKVVEYEERRSRPATMAATNQMGYDVSSDDQHRGVKRLIEVKGLQQRWTGDATVALTGPQFDVSRAEPPAGCEYWLYVVDGLGTESPRIHSIHRFAAKVERVYLQAQDWLPEVDTADRDRFTESSAESLGLPIIEFDAIDERKPTTEFLTRYPKSDLADIVPVGGFLKCLPVDFAASVPSKGRLVMLLPRQVDNAMTTPCVGEFRWSLRQSLDGQSQYVEVSLRPKTADPVAKPLTLRVSMADWLSFRPYAVCEPLVES